MLKWIVKPTKLFKKVSTMQKHKYYDVIVAWANGEQIQCLVNIGDEWGDVWEDFEEPVNGVPCFNNPNFKWRIKPKTYTKKYRMAIVKHPLGQDVITICLDGYTLDSPAEYEKGFVRWIGEAVEVEFDE